MAKKKKKDAAAVEPQVMAAPPEGFRELSQIEQMEVENYMLKVSNANNAAARWAAESDYAKSEERRAKLELAALEAVAKQLDAKLGVVDAQKDIVRVGNKVYVRKPEAAPAPVPEPAAPEGPQPLQKADIKVIPGPRP